MSLRKRIFLLIGVALLIIGAILFWIFFRGKINKTPPADTNSQTQTPDNGIGEVNFKQPSTVPQTDTIQTANPDEVYAKQTARIFVERFWSYSNQNDNQHIADALELASDSMRQWIMSQSHDQSSTYAGITTEVLSSRILSHAGSKIQVQIEAQQITRTAEANGNITENTTPLKARVDLVKMNTTWLVEGVWKE